MSDSETDSTPEDDMIENKAFPQQRFSPVMKRHGITTPYRPKPIKGIPDSSGNRGPKSPVGVVAGQQNFSDRQIPRPSSNGSNFQPTGAVFKAKTKHTRYMSTGSMQDINSTHYEHVGGRTERVGSTRNPNQPVKIHNITMATGSEQRIIMSSNLETTVGQNNRVLMGKYSNKKPLPVTTTQSILQQTLQSGPQSNRPITTTTLQILASPHAASVSNSNAGESSVVPTFTTVGKPISAPGLKAALQQSSAVTMSGQPHAILPNTSTANLKNVGGTILLQGIPTSQYGMIISSPNLASPTINKVNQVSSTGSTQYFSGLQNIVPSVASQAQTVISQSMPQQAMFTNFIVKPNQSMQPNVNTSSRGQTIQPTQVQCLLPSLRMNAQQQGNHVIQMALPGNQLPQGCIQLTFTGNQGASPPQSVAQLQQVQLSPQQVQPGKIQIPNSFKVMPSPIKQQPSPAASPQLNTAQTIQVMSPNIPNNKQTVTQYVTVNQSPALLTPQQVQIQSAAVSQSVSSRQPSHIQVCWSHVL